LSERKILHGFIRASGKKKRSEPLETSDRRPTPRQDREAACTPPLLLALLLAVLPCYELYLPYLTMSSAEVASTPPEKKIKMSYPMAPDEEWPAAWLMPDTVADQCLPNQLDPPVPQTAADMKALGICYWKMDAESYDYPVKAVPWDPKDATDPKLQALRDDRGA
jgi:hypothetical protein